MALVISETLKGNKLNGLLIAIAPLITDAPIVVLSIYLLNSFPGTDVLLGVLSLFGAVFLIYLGIQNLRFNPKAKETNHGYGSSLKYGIVTNLLSPHPYIFWITIGAPTFIKASRNGLQDAFAFIIGFYLLLIGSKVVVAVVSGMIKNIMQSSVYAVVMKLMGAILLILAALLVYDGYRQLIDHVY